MIEQILQRLQKVKGRNGSWTACCPAHDDKGPSLGIRAGEDGRILMHCFAGCEIHHICEALGIEVGDLFPPEIKVNYDKPAPKMHFYATDVLRIVALETQIVMISAFDMSKGKKLSTGDMERLHLAHERIDEAMRYANL